MEKQKIKTGIILALFLAVGAICLFVISFRSIKIRVNELEKKYNRKAQRLELIEKSLLELHKKSNGHLEGGES